MGGAGVDRVHGVADMVMISSVLYVNQFFSALCKRDLFMVSGYGK